uniref:Chromatin-remodeling ATPase INO80 n=1 Tax=Anopheles minimus TaxID=112268 RepID=A0A182WM91_9DIPT
MTGDPRHGAAPSKSHPVITAPDPYSFTPMDGSLVLLKNHNAINYRTLDFLHETNQDYVVIGTIGMPGVGKSTVLNLLNTNLYSPDQRDNKTECIFPVHGAINISGDNEVRMHITEDRLILLDCCEPVFGHGRKDFIQHEQDELKKLMILLRICHVIFVVQEEYYNIRLMRTLMWAEMMTQVHSNLPTKLVFIRNKVVPYSENHDSRERMINLYKQMFRNTSSFSVTSTTFGGDSGMQEEEMFNYIEFPILEKGCDTVVITEHLKETILLLRQIVYAGRNTIMGHNCSEKAWGQALVKLVDCPESNIFVDNRTPVDKAHLAYSFMNERMAQKESPPAGGGDSTGMICSNNMKKSLHTQRMLSAFGMVGFVKQTQRLSVAVASDSSSDEEPNQYSGSSDESEEFGSKFYHRAAARSYRERMFDFSTVGSERMWLKNLLLSETETESEISDVEEYIQQMLKDHMREKKIRERYNDSPKNSQYGYYSAGLLSDNDLFPEHRRSAAGKRKCKIDHGTGKTKGVRKKMKHAKKRSGTEGNNYSADGSSSSIRGPMFGDKKSQKLLHLQRGRPVASKLSDGGSGFEHLPDQDGSSVGTKRGRKMRLKTPEALNIRRRKMWQLMAKKEVGKLQRAKANNHKDTITNCRRVAALCMRVARQKAMQSQKLMKDTVWRAKRLTREMQVYWKRYDKVERETKRRMEREAEEQRKIDVEIVEAKRQQRKLNFLITQTELYAHFMSRKLGNVSAEEQLKILSQLDEESNPRLAAIDNYDCERMKQLAQKNATEAFRNERARTNQFDVVPPTDPASPPIEPTVSLDEPKAIETEEIAVNRTEPSAGIAELPQPSMFRGRLKGYQLKGVAWLANLYDQGISGILADEMGLGKTVQSIAFLCHIAEHYGVWGPFLVISPASTLHNWQQEMERFVPEFNVVPYWGSPNERKILRQFWEQKHLHTKDASFHVVITSYQLVVTDYKYFNRIKWQYMVLDEAQAIKSSSSMRWKLLLGFNCRNRLLLSGTPIQNSMAELWALLHFIMPTLFDSHEEFNEWFSKDIESHAENKTGIDEKQISRLHMILKPFMLRRIKKDVENELSDKIEIMVYCPLTTRQKLLYVALKKKICIEDLLHLTTVGGGGGGDGQSIDRNCTSNLMNLVMQFRKVCNHPELFERRDVRSPFCMKWSYELSERPLFRRQLLMDYTVPIDQQAMDRAHRLGQTKQVTVYRLICKGTIEERILQRAREKSEIQRMVINGDNFKPDTLKPKEVVSLLLDDEEIELKYRQKTEERRLMEDPVAKSSKERDRKQKQSSGKDTVGKDRKRTAELGASALCDEPGGFGDSAAPSPAQSERSNISDNTNKALDALDDSSNEASSMSFDVLREQRDMKARPVTRGASKRGRPRGSRRGGAVGTGTTRAVATEPQAIPDKG